MLSDLFFENYALFRNVRRSKIHEIITFANAKTKIRYDSKYKFIDMKIENKTYLKFHNEYIISGFTNKKLLSQRKNPFFILRKINSLTYEFDLFFNMFIHFVIFISQIKPVFSEPDFFGRTQQKPDSIRTADDTENIIKKFRIMKSKKY